MMKLLSGKGWYLWRLLQDPQVLVDVAKLQGVSHLLVKIANGIAGYNLTLAERLVPIAKASGIRVWGWHYLYHNDPIREAKIALQRIRETGVEGLVLDAEYECKNKPTQAKTYCGLVRSEVGNDFPLALSSYRFPSLHPELPWNVYRRYVNMDLPQVYWEQAHNAGAQLNRSLAEFKLMEPRLPYLPTGAAYKWNGWMPTVSDVKDFIAGCRDNGLPGFNFWEWDLCQQYLPDVWNTIAESSLGYPIIADPPIVTVIRVDTPVLNMRTSPMGSIIDQTQQGDLWPVVGSTVDVDGRTWYEVRAFVAGWLVRSV